MIIDRLHSELGILVDSVKHGSGSTNDGNTARRFFANPSVVSEITNFNKELLERFAVVLDTLPCGYEVDSSKFLEYCLQTARLYEQE